MFASQRPRQDVKLSLSSQETSCESPYCGIQDVDIDRLHLVPKSGLSCCVASPSALESLQTTSCTTSLKGTIKTSSTALSISCLASQMPETDLLSSSSWTCGMGILVFDNICDLLSCAVVQTQIVPDRTILLQVLAHSASTRQKTSTRLSLPKILWETWTTKFTSSITPASKGQRAGLCSMKHCLYVGHYTYLPSDCRAQYVFIDDPVILDILFEHAINSFGDEVMMSKFYLRGLRLR
jgi:hypothetical protein